MGHQSVVLGGWVHVHGSFAFDEHGAGKTLDIFCWGSTLGCL